MFDLGLTAIGWPHTVASLVAMAALLPAMLARKGSHAHRMAGRVYALFYAVSCLTAFGIYGQQRFWFPHWLSVAGLLVLAAGYGAARLKPEGWRYIHFTAMLLSAYNLYAGAVNEVFLRVRPLRDMAGPDLTSPIVAMTHGVVMLAFVLLIGGYFASSWVSAARRRTPGSGNLPLL